MSSRGDWDIRKRKAYTNHVGRRFVSYDAFHRPTGVHRTVTVILRHDRSGLELVTGHEARRLAIDALAARGITEVHQTIDPDEVAFPLEEP